MQNGFFFFAPIKWGELIGFWWMVKGGLSLIKNLAKYLTNNHSLRDTVHVGRLMPPFSNIEGWALIFLFL